MPKKRKTTRIRVPKPDEPKPPRHPSDPEPTKPWDETSGPDPLKWLKLGKKKGR